MRFLLKYDSTTTITSTEISDFESIQDEFITFENKQVYDIENSSTFFRVAGGYLKMLGNNVEGVNVKEFKTILDKGIMPSEKVLDFPVDCNTLTGSVNL